MTIKNISLLDEYQKLVTNGSVKDDIAQRHILTKLAKLSLALEELSLSKKNFFNKIIAIGKTNPTIKGLYIHGAVGRGKSMLMDLFFVKLGITKKKRIHFHAFMLDIHAFLHAWRADNRHNINAVDPIPALAKNFAKQVHLLCLDELQVNDIADAMILGRLFNELFKNNVVIVATSNRHPDDLYKDGLQRELFLPFIAMLKDKLEIVEIFAAIDYRLAHLKALKNVYYTPLGRNANKFITNAFADLSANSVPQPLTINVSGRQLTINKTHADIAWSSFADLCEKPLGSADYIAIASSFGTLLLEGIPQLGKDNRNEARRFVTLIDALYEHKVKLIATAATKPELLYIAGDGSFEFARTVSRLIEMQSEQYLVSAHLA